MQTLKQSIPVLLAFIVITFAASIPGQINGPGEWYNSLVRPPLTPPGWVFGVAWTLLYLLIAVSAWLVWRTPHPNRNRALGLWGLQLFLNAAWSPVFFGAERPDLALGIMVLLLIALLATIHQFRRINRRAALLLLPYLAWLGFATYLNLGFLVLN